MATAMPQFPDAAQLMAQYNAAQQMMSVGNILQFTPPGFNQPLRVKFPDYRLPVCEKCKKNYKTRDMCRVRNGHTDLPWSPVYICITLDASCTDENGKYTQGPFTVRPQQWQPYCIKKEKVTGYFDSKTPICAACKKKNYTRSFCRERHKHRSLPWSTVYVVLSSLGGPNNANPNDNANSDDDEKDATSPSLSTTQTQTLIAHTNTIDPAEAANPGSGSDDIHAIDPSRTFLVKVSAKGCTVQWVEMDESELHAFGVSSSGHHHHHNPHHHGMGMNMQGMGMNMNMQSYPQYNAAAGTGANKYGGVSHAMNMYNNNNTASAAAAAAGNMFYSAAAAGGGGYNPYNNNNNNNPMGLNMNAMMGGAAAAGMNMNMNAMNMSMFGGMTVPANANLAASAARNSMMSSTGSSNDNNNNNNNTAAVPSPMQMAQFPGMNTSAAAAAVAASNGDDKEEDKQQQQQGGGGVDVSSAAQYQQYMNWQAQMWYHQQAMMAAGVATGVGVGMEEVANCTEAASVQEEEEDEAKIAHDHEDMEAHQHEHEHQHAVTIKNDNLDGDGDNEDNEEDDDINIQQMHTHHHHHVEDTASAADVDVDVLEEEALEAAVPDTHVITTSNSDSNGNNNGHNDVDVNVHNAFDEALDAVSVVEDHHNHHVEEEEEEDHERAGKRTKKV